MNCRILFLWAAATCVESLHVYHHHHRHHHHHHHHHHQSHGVIIVIIICRSILLKIIKLKNQYSHNTEQNKVYKSWIVSPHSYLFGENLLLCLDVKCVKILDILEHLHQQCRSDLRVFRQRADCNGKGIGAHCPPSLWVPRFR